MITKEAIEAAAAEIQMLHGAGATVSEQAERILTAALAAMPSEREIDEGRFEQWTLADFAGQCRMQARDNLDPEYSQFMAALAGRLASLASMPAPAVRVKPQCCMCGKLGLSTTEGDGGTECELSDGRWVCSFECWDRALTPAPDLAADNERLRSTLEELANAYSAHGYSDAMDAVQAMKDIAKEAINANR